MRVLFVLTYYRPHVSGLTIYVERLGRALAQRGHEVTVLTSQFAADLAREERVEGVRVVRIPVVARISKGVLMPQLGRAAHRLAREHDVLSIHLPQFDSPGLCVHARLTGKPAVLTYHCDLKLPMGIFNRVVDQAVFAANFAGSLLADKIVTYTQDYADHSRLLRHFRQKLVIIPPPVVMPEPRPESVQSFRHEYSLGSGPHIGFAARFASEKGVEYLVEALPALLSRFPQLRVLFAGPYQGVVGESDYWSRLFPKIDALDAHWQFLGMLSPEHMPAFFAACDVLVVPSLNSTESFGLVQVEAMLCGTPVVASDLPGVRQPVKLTGMGEIVRPADAAALAQTIARVLENPSIFKQSRATIAGHFALERTIDRYVELFDGEIRRKKRIKSS